MFIYWFFGQEEQKAEMGELIGEALAWIFPLGRHGAGPDSPDSPDSEERWGRLLPPVAVLALLPGAALGLAHKALLQLGPPLPPSSEALALLVLWALLGGLRPLRGAALALTQSQKEPPGAWALSALAGALVLALLCEREALCVIVSIRNDISYPGARLLLFWPVVGRWASLLAGQGAPGAQAGPFWLASGALLTLFFALLPPAFFLAAAPALLAGGLLGQGVRRWRPWLGPRVVAEAAAGAGELGYLIAVAALALRY